MPDAAGPRVVDVQAITRVAQDYLKAIWSETEWGDPPITTKALAARFGTTPGNVSETVRRLAEQGLVRHEPYKAIVLTPTGTKYAIAMVRRHRLLETFLASTLGYRWEEVHEEAESLEHAVSETFLDRIDTLLGHPAHDPHGDPIPSADGRVARPADWVRLTDAEPGEHVVVRVSDADTEQLVWLRDRSLAPGQAVRVEPADTVVVLVEGQRVPLPGPAADAVWVRAVIR